VSPFIGRQSELDNVLNLIQDPSVRLVTILGTGGVGKTRFALELAGALQAQFQHGAIFTPLAQLSTVDELLPALAGDLGVQLPPGGDLLQVVLDHLSNKQILLVLDNFEHLLEEAVLIRDILVAGSQVKVLVTSREKLNLESETLYHLRGLEFPAPDSLQKMEEFDGCVYSCKKPGRPDPDFLLTNRIHLQLSASAGWWTASLWDSFWQPLGWKTSLLPRSPARSATAWIF